ncbi:MAG TPA: Gfo/Idh/MocA family oxidoreductase [Planctomycetota bacterium]|jgi:predicted dehydrogenase|nr:Gfo/Idh/MocA family oxidoreductase [Planctomycetota bacterium]OQC21062.1 MAG: putative oxidoreductase YdgJ [Planctomycetes bacterium ADurb.Bin069]HNS00190.1 Gfo/Idh/MocA family oxidoreductase [Planctomycetota bacterium]HNU26681.1 Gfo/Idh/MocA family oxidoreductase [Planctomycetota bacterium]HOE30357.1 Gfo/Idh/MocA family oxidoreductase [Planctomycetota bacterium]
MRRRVGFIGFGFIGGVHAFAYRALPFHYERLPGEYELAAVATSRPETAEAARARGGFTRAARDWREIIEDPSIEIVHIATPNVYHREVLCAAIEAGKHIYCEKPLAATLAEARAVGAKLASYGGTSQMVLQNRFFAATVKAAELAREGFLGEVLCVRGAYLHSGTLDAHKALNWKATIAQGGGGVVNDLGPHILDLVELLAGPIDAVSAATRIALPDRRVVVGGADAGPPTAEDHAVALVRLAGGGTGTVEVSKVATGTLDELRIEVHGTGGALRFDLMTPNWLDVFDQRRPEEGWRRVPTIGNYPDKNALRGKNAIGWVRSHIACLYNFLCAAAEGRPAAPDLAAGIRLQALCDAVYRSAASGSWCAVEEQRS